ncbi:MAG: 8-amino-7-oxononanoate synthase [Alcanivoracaceae bacterium]|nr:8-amino-7-oxononanoate synthase [Alcanivoracaceae bacterium]
MAPAKHGAFDLSSALDQRHAQQRYRQRATQQIACGREAVVDGKKYLNFCSNDYLGLANHPDVAAAFAQASADFGVGSGASHLVCGHSHYHHQLEEQLADFCQTERALLFSTGYMANFGIITALLDKQDAVFEDRLNHASLIDGGLASGARFRRYLHADASSLQEQLKISTARRKLVVTDGIFSMDGDVAPLKDLMSLCEKHDAWLMVDDAHGFGVVGEQGRGVASLVTPAERPQIIVGTLGKAFGTFGAFVAGSEALIETLIQFSRSYIYTTALPPAVAAASLKSLEILRAADDRREHLRQLVSKFREGAQQIGLQLMPSESPIQPIVIGGDGDALALSHSLKDSGFLISAIRPPTVPEGSARLRVTLSAAHSLADVDALLVALSRAHAAKK